MRRGRIADDLDPVGELHTHDQFWQLVVSVDAAPSFLGAFDQQQLADRTREQAEEMNAQAKRVGLGQGGVKSADLPTGRRRV